MVACCQRNASLRPFELSAEPTTAPAGLMALAVLCDGDRGRRARPYTRWRCLTTRLRRLLAAGDQRGGEAQREKLDCLHRTASLSSERIDALDRFLTLVISSPRRDYRSTSGCRDNWLLRRRSLPPPRPPPQSQALGGVS